MISARLRGMAAVLFLFGITACLAATPQSLPTPTPSAPTAGVTATDTVVPATPTGTPAPLLIPPQIVVLADGLPEPDDLVLAPDGSIYLSDVTEGTVKRYTPDSGLETVLSGLNEPEGMVFLPDGSLVIAEQGANRLMRYDFTTHNLTPFLSLTNNTDQLGVDGLAWDAAGRTIILPDSPNGTILRVGPDGQIRGQVASGFARPTGAWVEPDGSLLVVDENGNALSRIHPNGSMERLAELPIPDDVIEDAAGNIFVATIGDNAVHLISAGTHQDLVLAGDILDPQGLIFDTDGNLIVSDSAGHRLLKLIIH